VNIYPKSYMRVCRRSAILMVSLLPVACSGAVTTQFVQYDASGVPELFRYGAVDRDFRTVIHGNPSAGTTEAFQTAVIDAMQGHTWGRRTNFTTTPSENARDGYRVVMVFSGEHHIGGRVVCQNPDPGTLALVTSQVHLQAAFCFEERVLSQVQVSFKSFSSLQNPVLGEAVSQAVLHLFPLRDPSRQADPSDHDIVAPP